jgi:ABC-type multidrug transport system fused ATPase/permease subunit
VKTVGSFTVLKAVIVAIGMKYTSPIIVASFVFFYLLGAYYLRTSRQVRYLDLEARAPLFAEFTETAYGVEHIRAFGWQKQVMSRACKALDHSQRPFYYMNAIQRWLLLNLDLLTLVLSLAVVLVALYARDTFSQPGFALSLFMAIQINSALTGLIDSFAAVETALGAVSRLRIFANTTPQEESPDNAVELPKDWPVSGEIIFDGVTAKYE